MGMNPPRPTLAFRWDARMFATVAMFGVAHFPHEFERVVFLIEKGMWPSDAVVMRCRPKGTVRLAKDYPRFRFDPTQDPLYRAACLGRYYR